jgi:predicted Fe-Mo cluster-binding NifX family protein
MVTARRLRIVVPSADGSGLESQVSVSFGRCPFFTMVSVESGAIVAVDILGNPHQEDHGPGMVPEFIRSLKADVVIATNVGLGARALLATMSIKLLSGAMGGVGTVARSYLAGKLRDVGSCASSTGARPRACACGRECRRTARPRRFRGE